MAWSRSTSDQALIVLTARLSSERLPGKVMADVGGRPLIGWIAERLAQAGRVVLATTDLPEDRPLAAWAREEGIPCFRGSSTDVLGRILEAARLFGEGEAFLMRGLADCPFPEVGYIQHATRCLAESEKSMFLWALPPYTWPVYGAREFPLRRNAWELAARKASLAEEREHPDLFFHRYRSEVGTLYHEPPPPLFFRPYRLEVDWPEDLELVRALHRLFRRWPSLAEVIQALDGDPKLVAINAARHERTGPTVSYSSLERLGWLEDMRGQPIRLWNGSWLKPAAKEGKPIFCKAGLCFLGSYARGKLVLRDGTVLRGAAELKCACGAGRFWSAKPEEVGCEVG